jgi:endo-1,4-beta-xylanase
MRDVLTIAFSHPAVCGIMLWQTWNQDEQHKHKTLWRADWSIKPAGQVWRDQVLGEWWTDEAGTTDAQGSFTTRGFLGDYEISVRAGEDTRVVAGQFAPGGGEFRVVF